MAKELIFNSIVFILNLYSACL